MSMPSPHHPSAPKFNGQAESLTRFLKEVHLLGTVGSLTDKQIIEWTLMYIDPNDAELWESQTNASGNDWDAFKKAIIKLYPGADGDRKYSINDLQILVTENAHIPGINPDQFGKFYRDFLRISTFLKIKSRLSDFEAASMFMSGLHANFQLKVRVRLRLKNPDHHPDDPWTFDDVSNAALFIVSPSSAKELIPSTTAEVSNNLTSPFASNQPDPLNQKPTEVNSNSTSDPIISPSRISQQEVTTATLFTGNTSSMNVKISYEISTRSFDDPPPGLSRVAANAPINIRPTSPNPTVTDMSCNTLLPFASADTHQVNQVDELLNEEYKPHNFAVSAATTDTLDPKIDLRHQIKSCQPTEILQTQTIREDLRYGSIAASAPILLQLTGLQSSYKKESAAFNRRNQFYRFLWFPARKKRLKYRQCDISKPIDWEVNIQRLPGGRGTKIHTRTASHRTA